MKRQPRFQGRRFMLTANAALRRIRYSSLGSAFIWGIPIFW